MPPLTNTRHERFAQELAKGKTQEAAYIEAGYASGDARAKASRLLATNGNIAARVAEIQERAAVRAEITTQQIAERLMGIADKAERIAEASGLSVARQSMMDVAKLLGLVVDKSELTGKDGGALQTVSRIELVPVEPVKRDG